MGYFGFIMDEEVAFFVPGDAQVKITSADGSPPYEATVQIDSWSGSINGLPIVTIPLEEA
jgi:hypothetical protein